MGGEAVVERQVASQLLHFGTVAHLQAQLSWKDTMSRRKRRMNKLGKALGLRQIREKKTSIFGIRYHKNWVDNYLAFSDMHLHWKIQKLIKKNHDKFTKIDTDTNRYVVK
jgi:hypothetical protein